MLCFYNCKILTYPFFLILINKENLNYCKLRSGSLMNIVLIIFNRSDQEYHEINSLTLYLLSTIFIKCLREWYKCKNSVCFFLQPKSKSMFLSISNAALWCTQFKTKDKNTLLAFDFEICRKMSFSPKSLKCSFFFFKIVFFELLAFVGKLIMKLSTSNLE